MKIVIYSTKGQQKYTHETTVETWGELKEELAEIFDFGSLNATESITRCDLSVDAAILPKQDFVLFLRPKDTKLGAYSYKEAKSLVKEDKNLQKRIKDAYGTDYTHLSTNQLNEAIENVYVKEVNCKAETTEKQKIKEDVLKKLDTFLRENGFNNFSISIAINEVVETPTKKVPTKAELEAEALRLEQEEIKKLQEEADAIFGKM